MKVKFVISIYVINENQICSLSLKYITKRKKFATTIGEQKIVPEKNEEVEVVTKMAKRHPFYLVYYYTIYYYSTTAIPTTYF